MKRILLFLFVFWPNFAAGTGDCVKLGPEHRIRLVVDVDGAPAAGLKVNLWFDLPEWGRTGESKKQWSHNETLSDDDGNWRFDRLPENAVNVRVLVYDRRDKEKENWKNAVVTEEELRLQNGVVYLELESKQRWGSSRGNNW